METCKRKKRKVVLQSQLTNTAYSFSVKWPGKPQSRKETFSSAAFINDSFVDN